MRLLDEEMPNKLGEAIAIEFVFVLKATIKIDTAGMLFVRFVQLAKAIVALL